MPLTLGSGLTVLLTVGFPNATLNWDLMFASGLLMMAVFGYV